MINLAHLQKATTTTCFDYQKLKHLLSEQSNPRRAIGRLLSLGHLTRVKKGLYVWTDSDVHKEVLANLLYGPSYLSLESALSFYQLIPERVSTVTSVTLKRKKAFNTPLGLFSYDHLNLEAYASGYVLKESRHRESFLIATPEKALLDTLYLRVCKTHPAAISDYRSFQRLIEEDLRIAADEFLRLNQKEIKRLIKLYRSRPLSNLLRFL